MIGETQEELRVRIKERMRPLVEWMKSTGFPRDFVSRCGREGYMTTNEREAFDALCAEYDIAGPVR